MRWRPKVLAQHSLSLLPFGSRIEAWARHNVTRTTDLGDEQYRFRVQWGALPYLRAIADRWQPDERAELRHLDAGCGWQPTVPFLFWSAGIETQRLSDIESHLSIAGCNLIEGAQHRNHDWLASQLPGVQLRALPRAGAADAGGGRPDLDLLLARRGMSYAVPERVDNLRVGDSSFDIATCTGVLAYLRPEEIDRAISGLKRAIGERGLVGVYVHLTDDFATTDPTISSFNFLRYDDAVWNRWICSGRFYNNRLRVDDYRKAFDDHGLRIVSFAAEAPTAGDLRALSVLPLADRFAGRDPVTLGTRRFVAVLEAQ